jgi:hypothetical protein
VRAALATLPWVEQGSVNADVPSRKVMFNVKDAGSFDFEKIKDALNEQGFDDTELVAAPEPPAKKT